MYAIIQVGGKQHRVSVGECVDVDAFFEGDAGTEVTFPALLVSKEGKSQIGAPTVPGCKVHGKLVDIVAGPKVTSVKYIPGNHRKKIGHRQHYSRIEITSIN